MAYIFSVKCTTKFEVQLGQRLALGTGNMYIFKFESPI